MKKPVYSISLVTMKCHKSDISTCDPSVDFTNSVVIYAGFLGQNIMYLDDTTVARCRILLKSRRANSETKYLFDCVTEGIVLPIVDVIHKMIDNTVDSRNVYFYTGAINGKEIYDDYVIRKNISNPINVVPLNYWELHDSLEVNSPEYKIKVKEKLFLSFNRVVRPQRTIFLALLEELGLREKAFYSYLNSNHTTEFVEISECLRMVRNFLSPELFNTVEKNIRKLYPQLPLTLNVGPNENVTHVIQSDIDYFTNSYFSFVTETSFFNVYTYDPMLMEKSIFFSEKVYKPIRMRHPFILANAAGSLKYLKAAGYKTFSPMIDESYDDIVDDQQRILAIVNEINRLSRYTEHQWLEWQSAVKPVVEHNYNHFLLRRGHIEN